MRILILGHASGNSKLGGAGNGPSALEAVDLVERMVRRAAMVGVSLMNVVGSGSNPNIVPTSVLKMERLTLFETLLNLCAYQVRPSSILKHNEACSNHMLVADSFLLSFISSTQKRAICPRVIRHQS